MPIMTHHYLYDSFYQAARGFGAKTIIDGLFGEMTMTHPFPLARFGETLRAKLSTMRAKLRSQDGRPVDPGPIDLWPQCGFHVRLSDYARATVPDAFAQAWHHVAPGQPPARKPRDIWAYSPGVHKLGDMTTESIPGLQRHDYPFRDERLLTLFASFPAGFAEQGGLDRAPARTLLRGNLPDSITLRPKGAAFSPDFLVRLQSQADQAIDRIALFRAAGVDEWIDLDWLEKALKHAQASGIANAYDAYLINTSVTVSEYLSWWPGE
jgi:asparagine synthase (glutamine-hydrolysing)